MRDKIKFIEKLAESMNENKIESVKYEENNFEISLTKKRKERNIIFGGAIPQTFPQATTNTEQEIVTEEINVAAETEIPVEEITGTKITSPMVGTYYAAPSPTSAPFIKEGDMVTKGQTLCIVEAMKLMNEVKSTVSGKIKKILVEDRENIKKGQVLVIIE